MKLLKKRNKILCCNFMNCVNDKFFYFFILMVFLIFLFKIDNLIKNVRISEKNLLNNHLGWRGWTRNDNLNLIHDVVEEVLRADESYFIINKKLHVFKIIVICIFEISISRIALENNKLHNFWEGNVYYIKTQRMVNTRLMK